MYQQGNALIKFYYHINPDNLSIEEWSDSVTEILFVLDMQRNMIANIVSPENNNP